MAEGAAVPGDTPVEGLPRCVGRYRILGRLGKGSMGVVYAGFDDKMERNVAVKLMMTDLEADPEARTRFYREARVAGRLLHRNIVTVFDLGEDNGRPFIVMERLEGESLADYLKRPQASSLEAKLDVLVQACEGLAVAHAKGIVHRDVKPGNLVVQPDGLVKILDFGLARLASFSITASGAVMGTPDYMSPEQSQGKEVDQRSDIFSMAAVAYYVLTGRKPFGAANLVRTVQKLQGEEPPPIDERHAPAALARVVMKGLAKSPEERYQRIAEMAADLDQIRRRCYAEAGRLARSLAEQALDEGRRLVAEGDWTGATRAFERAVAADPAFDEARKALERIRSATVRRND